MFAVVFFVITDRAATVKLQPCYRLFSYSCLIAYLGVSIPLASVLPAYAVITV